MVVGCACCVEIVMKSDYLSSDLKIVSFGILYHKLSRVSMLALLDQGFIVRFVSSNCSGGLSSKIFFQTSTSVIWWYVMYSTVLGMYRQRVHSDLYLWIQTSKINVVYVPMLRDVHLDFLCPTTVLLSILGADILRKAHSPTFVFVEERYGVFNSRQLYFQKTNVGEWVN